MLICGFTGLHAQKGMFDKLSDNDNVSIVYVSKAMLKMMPNMETGGANLKSLAGKLEQIEIYSSENKDAITTMKTEIEGLTKSKAYETLMAIKDKKDKITFYAHKENNNFKDLVMFINDPEECTIIRIMGNFTAEDIQKVMEGEKTDK